ncbi:hypothetical protein RUM43_012094 [Polyplax serrata]|uniref:Protein CDV3 homolog n=1 Tax=Polyplax serrata TaxID=468196 RepID=A0AAN8S4C3_POLSC
MADLDDFFAKKDRKKSKGKKFTTTEDIAKKMEETGRKIEKPLKEKMTSLPGPFGPDGDDIMGNNEEDEEWKEFKEEEKKDYTGLKIQNLNLQDLDDSDKNDRDLDGDADDSDQHYSNSSKKSPWKVVDNVDRKVQQAASEKKEKSPVPVTKSYVLPQLRNQAQNRDRFNAGGKPEAPDITNQKYFPTLSAATNESSTTWTKRKQEAGFEEVRNSRAHPSRGDPTRVPQVLRIGNRYGALETENS